MVGLSADMVVFVHFCYTHGNVDIVVSHCNLKRLLLAGFVVYVT